MQTFKHGSTTITCDDMGLFHAERDGVKLEAGSLAGMVKKLTKKPDVEPFDALDTYGYEVTPVRVVGINKKSGRRYSWVHDHWKLASGAERRHVYIDTPECRALLRQQDAMRKRHEKVRKKQEAETNEHNKKLEPFNRTPPKRR